MVCRNTQAKRFFTESLGKMIYKPLRRFAPAPLSRGAKNSAFCLPVLAFPFREGGPKGRKDWDVARSAGTVITIP